MATPDPTTFGLEPLPNRFTRATALGCLGILGVFVLPILLVMPLGDWHLAPWLLQLLELAAFLAMAGGVWLLGRVPAGRTSAGADPRHPLTRAGRTPVVERPAGTRNRLTLAALAALTLTIAIVFIASGSSPRRPAHYGLMLGAVGLLGGLCVVLGVGVAAGRVPVPAWRWIRAPIGAPGLPQGLATCLLGATALGWALLAAAGSGYVWGRAGLYLLVLIAVLLTPLARRWPSRPSADEPDGGPSQSRSGLPPREDERA